MRRWLAIFLLVLIPLQTSWAAVSSYCQHENGNAAQHLGHHDHQHQVDGKTPSGSNQPAGSDADCATCHAMQVSILVDCVISVAPDPGGPMVAPPHGHIVLPRLDRPERPNWLRPA